jgi:hypothetical protein
MVSNVAISALVPAQSPDYTRGERTQKGYYRHQFKEAWKRYLGQGAIETEQRNNPDTTGTSDTFRNGTPEAGVPDEIRKKTAWIGHRSGVPDQEACGVVNDGSDDPGIPGFLDRRHQAANGHCNHCQQLGTDGDPLLDLNTGEQDVRLHRDCIGAWKSVH